MHGHSLLTVQIVKFSQLGHKSYQCSGSWRREGGGQTCLLKGLKTRHIKEKVNMWIEMQHGHTYWKWT